MTPNSEFICISDDLMKPLFENRDMETFFTNEAHGWNTSILYTLQNYFPLKKDLTIVRQTCYKVIFNDVSDKTYLSTISQRISGRSNFLKECFLKLKKSAPDQRYNYIMVDSHPGSDLTHRHLFIKTNIFPSNDKKIRPLFFIAI